MQNDLNSLGAEKGPELQLRGWEINAYNLERLLEEGVEADSK